MWSLTRRRLVHMAGLSALLPLVRPASALAGLLDSLLGRPISKPIPAITPNEEFYLTSYRSPPTIRVHEWSLSVKGLVERPLTLSYHRLLAMPAVSQIVTLECVGNTVGGEFISTADWKGVPLRTLLEEAGADAKAYDVVFRAADDYSDSITLSRAMAGDVLIAHHMNGVPLPQAHGFPARAIVPGCYGMKSVQWLTEIEIVANDYKGYYAQKGWTDEAIVKTTSWIGRPGHGEMLQGGMQRIEGLAYAGTRGIKLVEVSTDGGETWQEAELQAPQSTASWLFWHYDWTATASGHRTLVVRATDGTGRRQTSIEQDPAPDGATGLHEITVTVAP
jgi:DMSO/TMAO reductase YedYZ molybdopterin-dependent catalytic subunit